jgi:hypothetical protein
MEKLMSNEPIITESQLIQRAEMEKSVVAPPAFEIDLSSPEAIQRHVQQMSGMMEYKAEVIKIGVKRAKPEDIRSMAKKPYFTEAFCEQLFAMLGGGTVQLLKNDLTQEEDGNFSYCVIVRISHPILGSIDALGSASSRDQFLGSVQKKVWDDKLGKKVPLFDKDQNPVMTRTLDEVSEHNLQQHARTRAVGSGIRKLLGLMNYTWEELEDMGKNRNDSDETGFDGNDGKPSDETPADPKLKAHLTDLVLNKKLFTWKEVGDYQKDLGLSKGKARELANDEMAKLVEALDKVAASREKKA